MTLIFDESLYLNGDEWKIQPFDFYTKRINGSPSPTWQDIIISGVGALTLVNAKADSLEYLKLFGKTIQESVTLPTGYTRLEYLQSNGNQYINTNFRALQRRALQIDFQYLSTPSSTSYVGGEIMKGSGTSLTSMMTIGAYSSNKIVVRFSDNAVNTGMDCGTTRHVVKVEEGKWTVDGVEGTFTPSGTISSSAYYMYLFGANRVNALFGSEAVRIFNAKMWDSGELRQDWYPCRRDSDGVLGMYDVINDTFRTNAGTGTFTAGADYAPTPTENARIICNNGVLKVRNKSGLPSGYIQLNYLACTGTQYVTTSYYPNTNTEYSTKIYVTANNVSPFATRWSGSPTYDSFGTVYSTVGTFVVYYGRYNSDEYYTIPATQISKNTEYNLSLGLNKITFNNTDYNITRSTFTSTEPLTLGAFNINGTASNLLKGRIYPFIIFENGAIVANYIPCMRKSDDELGMYDTVSETFLTNAGTGSFTAGDIDYSNYEVYADGDVETVVSSSSPVSLDNVGFTDNYYIQSNGNPKSNEGMCYSDLIPVEANSTYYYIATTTDTSRGRIIHAYDSNGDWIEQLATFNPASATYTRRISTGATTAYIRVSTAMAETDRQLQLVYIATAENLLAVGTYKDVQEVLTGNITRNVGVKVFDGSETWTTLTYSRGYYTALSGIAGVTYSAGGYCTHMNFVAWSNQNNAMANNSFGYNKNSGSSVANGNVTFKPDLTVYDTVTAWKNYLAAQFLAGTPVILVFPLGTATTESVTGQTMNISQGTNTIEITQSSIDNLELEAKYKAGVTVTVTEVQNANLDNSVTVTIN